VLGLWGGVVRRENKTTEGMNTRDCKPTSKKGLALSGEKGTLKGGGGGGGGGASAAEIAR